MKSDDADVIELSWGDEKPADASQKIRWSKHYTQEQISEIRENWADLTLWLDEHEGDDGAEVELCLELQMPVHEVLSV